MANGKPDGASCGGRKWCGKNASIKAVTLFFSSACFEVPKWVVGTLKQRHS